MHDLTTIEDEQKSRYPGLSVRREGEAIVVHIPARFRRRMGRSMILTDAVTPTAPKPEREANQTLIAAIANAYRWQEQLEAGEYAGLEDLARALGVDRTYAGRILRLTSLAPDIVEAILRGDEPEGISLEKLRKNLPMVWEHQRTNWAVGA